MRGLAAAFLQSSVLLCFVSISLVLLVQGGQKFAVVWHQAPHHELLLSTPKLTNWPLMMLGQYWHLASTSIHLITTTPSIKNPVFALDFFHYAKGFFRIMWQYTPENLPNADWYHLLLSTSPFPSSSWNRSKTKNRTASFTFNRIGKLFCEFF